MLMTNLPGSSTHIRHLFGSGIPVLTQKWNYKSANYKLAIDVNKTPSSNSTKWLCTKTFSPDYLQLLGVKSGKESSENNDDDEADGSDDDENEKGNDDIDVEEIQTQVEDIFMNKNEMTSAEWKDTIKLMAIQNSQISDVSCDAITMKKCLRYGNYHLANSYLHHIEQEGGELNLSTLGSYLQLCGEQVEQCGEARVLEYYHKLMSQVRVLDVRLLKNAIVGVTATQEWRRALDLMQRHKKIAPVCTVVYSSITVAAFRSGDYDLGWQIFDTMREEGQDPQDSVFMEWVRQCEAEKDRAQKEAMLHTLLHKLGTFETFPSVAVAKELTRFCREGLGWSAHYLKMTRGGRCPACKHQMEMKGVEKEEFRKLQEEFVSRVLLGSDIFRSTDPEEWQSFQTLVEKQGPFSMVVDGLNVAYVLGKKSPASREKALRDVVGQVLEQHQPGSRVLVLGRQHMKQWVRKMKWDVKKVCVFTISNMSKDDAFFLYAALQSGLSSKFITSDMLRDHLWRLKDRHLQDTFRRWQRTHQVMVCSTGGRARLLYPAKFSTVAQQQLLDQHEQEQNHRSSQSQARFPSTWHVPYDDGQPRQSYELPLTWLCLHPTLALSPPLPPAVSLNPIISTPAPKPPHTAASIYGSDTAESFLHRHHHRELPPMMKKGRTSGADGGTLVDDPDMDYNFARKGRPQQQQQRRQREEVRVKFGRFRVSDYVSSPPPFSSPAKNRKKSMLGKKDPPRLSEVKLRSIFDEDER